MFYLIGIVGAIIIVIRIIAANRKKRKSKNDNTEVRSKSSLKGDLASEMLPLSEKEQFAKQQGFWICKRCETYVPMKQKSCFICNNSYGK